MLAFVDESYQPKGFPNGKTTFGMVTILEGGYRDFDTALFRLKRHFFKKTTDPYDIELKGRMLLSNRAIELPRNRELVRQLWSLCREHKVTPFAVTQDGTITLASESNYLPQLYRGILWRLNTFLEQRAEDERRVIFFDGVDEETNKRIAISFNNFMFRLYRPWIVGHEVEFIFLHAASASEARFSARTCAGVR